MDQILGDLWRSVGCFIVGLCTFLLWNNVSNRAKKRATIKRSFGYDSSANSRHHFEKANEEHCELQGGRLNFYELNTPGDNTTTTVVRVKERRGNNILILKCGPGGREVLFVEFDSKGVTDEWQDALCRYTGQTHVPNGPALRGARPEIRPGPPLRGLRPLDIGPMLAEFNLLDLQNLKVMDYRGNVIVKEAIPLCQLHVGDTILLRNAQGLAMNARELTECIRTSIVLTLARGAVCTVKEEENELAIIIKAYKTVKLDTVDLIRRAFTSHCSLHYAEKPELSNLTITEINNISVAIGSHPDQIDNIMREALETSGGELTLHLVPQSLQDAMAE